MLESIGPAPSQASQAAEISTPTLDRVPDPDPVRRLVFVTGPKRVAEIHALHTGSADVPGTRPARISELQRWPVRDTVDGASLLAGATHTTTGDPRIGGGEPVVFIDGTQVSSSLR